MEVWGSEFIVVDVVPRKHGLAIMLMGLVEAEVRRMFEERKSADWTVVFEGTADESTNERRLKIVLWTFWTMNHNFYAKREFRIRRGVPEPRVYGNGGRISSALTVCAYAIQRTFCRISGTPIYAKIDTRSHLLSCFSNQSSANPNISIYFLLNEHPSVRRALPPVLQ